MNYKGTERTEANYFDDYKKSSLISFNIEFDYRFAPPEVFDDLAEQRLEATTAIWEFFITDEFPNIPTGTEMLIDLGDGRIEPITLDR